MAAIRGAMPERSDQPTRFDRSYLPDAVFEFVVIADTHHIVDPGMYSAEGESVTPTITRDWAMRGDVAIRWARDLGPLPTFHLGDLQQEYPGHPSFDTGRRAAIDQMQRAGFPMHHVAGNMDIGDKPDPTMPAGWLRDEYLAVWDEDFGPSFRSLDLGPFHFAILNSQLLNSTLKGRDTQRAWLEEDLAASSGRRIVLFLHVPPFLVDEDEPGLGSYDVLDEPDRSWLLGLARTHRVEAVFAGHTHFRLLNRVAATRIHIAPSTTTTRPGFYEALAVAPPDRGWSDTAKLGFLLVRATGSALAVHTIRTSGRTDLAEPGPDRQVILAAVTAEIPLSPLGTYLRLPLASRSDGAVIYPYHVRHRVRDDYPLLACVELGLRHARFPVRDLDLPLQRERLGLLRDEGVSLTAVLISDGIRPPDLSRAEDVDVLEIQTAGSAIPRQIELDALGRIAPSTTVSLAPIVVEATGKVHGRGRIGYREPELHQLDEALGRRGLRVGRAVCYVEPDPEMAWAAITALRDADLPAIGAFDFVVPMSGRDDRDQLLVAHAILAVSTVPGARLFIDPLQELDREAAVMGGLLDRLSNPRAAFHLVRALNSVLFTRAGPGAWRAATLAAGAERVTVGVQHRGTQHWLVTADRAAQVADALRATVGPAAALKWIDLPRAEAVPGISPARVAELAGRAGDVSLVTVDRSKAEPAGTHG